MIEDKLTGPERVRLECLSQANAALNRALAARGAPRGPQMEWVSPAGELVNAARELEAFIVGNDRVGVVQA